MKVKNYKQLFCISINEYDKNSDDICDGFVFQGSKNWDLYFDKKPKCKDIDVLSDIKLVDFQDKKNFESFLDKNKIIDYSVEHISEGDYLVLVDGCL